MEEQPKEQVVISLERYNDFVKSKEQLEIQKNKVLFLESIIKKNIIDGSSVTHIMQTMREFDLHLPNSTDINREIEFIYPHPEFNKK